MDDSKDEFTLTHSGLWFMEHGSPQKYNPMLGSWRTWGHYKNRYWLLVCRSLLLCITKQMTWSNHNYCGECNMTRPDHTVCVQHGGDINIKNWSSLILCITASSPGCKESWTNRLTFPVKPTYQKVTISSIITAHWKTCPLYLVWRLLSFKPKTD